MQLRHKQFGNQLSYKNTDKNLESSSSEKDGYRDAVLADRNRWTELDERREYQKINKYVDDPLMLPNQAAQQVWYRKNNAPKW